MPITINALDNEFAASSGSNIDVTPNYSYFDHPPNSTANLTITSNVGDDNPYVFELGDTYDLSWTGNGAGTMDDAVVIRSDFLPGGGQVVVFEGVNEEGDPFQIVWTPGFDLEAWYWDNGGGPSSPNAFWTEDQTTAETAVIPCFAADTMIATPAGDVPVASLRPGQNVVLFDGGQAPVLWCGAKAVLGRGTAAPVVIEPGTLGNTRRLVVSQNHRLMLASPLAELYFGEAEVFVPAKALVNGGTIRTESWRQIDYRHFLLSGHHVVLANGAPSESLFLGDVCTRMIDAASRHEVADFFPELMPLAGKADMQTARLTLTFREARLLATVMGLTEMPLPKSPPEILIAA